LAAEDGDRELFEETFMKFKTNTQLQARGRWYDWKLGMMQKITPDVQELYEGSKEVSEELPTWELVILHWAG
jgi:hypothetical protein